MTYMGWAAKRDESPLKFCIILEYSLQNLSVMGLGVTCTYHALISATHSARLQVTLRLRRQNNSRHAALPG
jgi:hypothetical protein